MKILVSGLLNTETTSAVRGFPINYYPIDYSFFGVKTHPSGVAYNITLALRALGDEVRLCSMLGDDFSADYIRSSLKKLCISTDNIRSTLPETPASVVLFAPDGARQIYCDLKNIQESEYDFNALQLEGVDLVVACNINFNRPLLRLAKQEGKLIATDVHVLSNIDDEYNSEFMEYADILFLSDEAIGDSYRDFIYRIADKYKNKVIVLGRGAKGAALYTAESGEITELPAYTEINVVNTVGAGDALFSSFLHFYTRGYTPLESLRRAQIFAALKIRENGASIGFVDEQEIENIINS